MYPQSWDGGQASLPLLEAFQAHFFQSRDFTEQPVFSASPEKPDLPSGATSFPWASLPGQATVYLGYMPATGPTNPQLSPRGPWLLRGPWAHLRLCPCGMKATGRKLSLTAFVSSGSRGATLTPASHRRLGRAPSPKAVSATLCSPFHGCTMWRHFNRPFSMHNLDRLFSTLYCKPHTILRRQKDPKFPFKKMVPVSVPTNLEGRDKRTVCPSCNFISSVPEAEGRVHAWAQGCHHSGHRPNPRSSSQRRPELCSGTGLPPQRPLPQPSLILPEMTCALLRSRPPPTGLTRARCAKGAWFWGWRVLLDAQRVTGC